MDPMVQSKRFSDSMVKAISELDLKYLRQMQAEMHRCSAKCCDSQTDSPEYVQQCVENCNMPLKRAHAYVQDELSSTQNRVDRCLNECSDVTKDRMGPNPTESESTMYKKEFYSCATKCVDQHINSTLPSIMTRMHHVLSTKNFPN